MATEQIVQEQIDAFNARDLERFVGCYSPDAVIVLGTDTVMAQGQDAMRAGYGPMFSQSPDLHCGVGARIFVGCWAVYEEHLSGVVMEGFPPDFVNAVVYQVEEGKIVKALILG